MEERKENNCVSVVEEEKPVRQARRKRRQGQGTSVLCGMPVKTVRKRGV